jgi:hypothetical protein
MSDLFAWFQNYLSLAKITAVTVPGMVVAFALILVLGPIPCTDDSKTCPYCSTSLKPVTASGSASDKSSQLSFSPASLTFTDKTKLEQTLTLSYQGKLFLDRVVVLSADLPHFKVDASDCLKGTFGNATPCKIKVTFDGAKPSLSWLRPRSVSLPNYGGTLKIDAYPKAANEGTPPPSPTEATAQIVATPEPGTAKKESADKQVTNTVVISMATWLTASSQPKSDTNTNAQPTSPTLPGRGSLLDKFKSLLPSDFGSDKKRDVDDLNAQCKDIPLYVISNSRPAVSKSDSTTNGNGNDKNKPGTPQYTEETTQSVEYILTKSDLCYAALSKVDEDLQAKITSLQAVATQDATDLTGLSNSLITAQNSGDTLVARDLKKQISEKRAQLDADQARAKSSSQAESYVAQLSSYVTSIRSSVSGQVNPPPPTTSTSTTSAAADVFATIQQNFLKFLLFSLILGQILDPIQRGLISFVGPRRNVFEVFNNVYGQSGDGEIRYGDRRLPPWTRGGTFSPLFRRPRDEKEAVDIKATAERVGLRFGPADFRFIENMNIYDPDYALGAGYISQSEFNGIFNEFYTQSQITSGLVLPLLALSLCIGIRIVCCMSSGPVGATAWLLLGPVLATIYFGAIVGACFAFLVTALGSKTYGRVIWDFMNDLFGGGKGGASSPLRYSFSPSYAVVTLIVAVCCVIWLIFADSGWCWWVVFAVILMVVALTCIFLFSLRYSLILLFATLITCFAIWSIHANSDLLGWDVLLVILIPCIFLFPLWISGLDRLHKYYSELQARIGGNILRLQQTTQQKMVDLINQSDSLISLRANLAQASQTNADLLHFLDSFLQDPGPGPSPWSEPPSAKGK